MTTLAVTDGDVLLPDARVRRVDVLIDQDDGEILELGENLGDDADETLDASDSLVTPGFVNGHCHVAMTLLRGYADDKPLEAWLREDIWPVEAALTGESVRAGAELGLLEMIKGGVTAFADMYFHVHEIADAVEEAGVRGVIGHTAITVGKDKDEAEARADMEESLEVAIDLDGAADGRIATTFQPHSLTTVGEEYLREYIPRAREAGVPIHFHANETRAEVDPIVDEYGMRPLEYARDVGLLEPEDFIAHGVHVDETEIELLAETGAGVIHCPASNMKLASGMAPIQQLLEAGVTVGIGTDGAASNNDLSILDEARDAAMIGKLAANDASAVDAGSVFDLLTAGGAEAIGLPGGRLEVGGVADLAVIDLEKPHLTPRHDLVSHLVYAAAASDVRHTVCDGQVLMRDREVQTLEEAAVLERAQTEAEALIARAES